MNSNDDQSSVPAAKFRARHDRCTASVRLSRGIVLAILIAAFLFVAAPRLAAQTPSEPPAAAQPTQQPGPATPSSGEAPA